MEPVTTRIMRLLEVLSSYSFNLYYIKGKDMILSDFLSRQKIEDSNTHEIIPISFNMRNILHDQYYNIGSVLTEDKYSVHTRSQSKSIAIKLPEVHGEDKGIIPNVQPEKQTLKLIIVSPEVKTPTWKKPRLGQGRAGLRSKEKVVTPSLPNKPAQVVPPSEKQKSEITAQPQASIGPTLHTEHIPVTLTVSKQPLKPNLFTREVPQYPDPQMRPPPGLEGKLKDFNRLGHRHNY